MSLLVQNVSKRFGARHAVRDLSLSVSAGEVFAFLGPNGAGKTTTIKMMCGLLRPDSGRIEVCGADLIHDGPRARAALAYVPDTPFVYEKLSGREFCQFVARLYNLSGDEADRRLARWAERLDMTDFLDELSETYSHGQRQKLALAAALLHDPRVLVFDEPMVGLDPRTMRAVKDTFRELAAAGTTVFISTHMLDVAEAVASRVGVIHHGQLVACGSLGEMVSNGMGERRRLEDVFLSLTRESRDRAAAGGQ